MRIPFRNHAPLVTGRETYKRWACRITFLQRSVPLVAARNFHDFTMTDVPSTLKQPETAVALIEMAVAKHNTRWDKTFFKAVRYLRSSLCVC